MAVIVQYIVVRDGDKKMTFATKKEADAYDKMLDIADNLFDFIELSDIDIDEIRKEEISLLFAEKRQEVMNILKGISPKAKGDRKKGSPSSETAKNRSKSSAKQTPPKKADTSDPATTPEAKPAPKTAVNAASRTRGASATKRIQVG